MITTICFLMSAHLLGCQAIIVTGPRDSGMAYVRYIRPRPKGRKLAILTTGGAWIEGPIEGP
jgi:hypothetical protein